jgi:hypothetical protein
MLNNQPLYNPEILKMVSVKIVKTKQTLFVRIFVFAPYESKISIISKRPLLQASIKAVIPLLAFILILAL